MDKEKYNRKIWSCSIVETRNVFEISFEKIQISKRHKSGIAVRFPRITKWRKDKKINDADSIENAYALMKKIS